jgi:hypothetical protein
MSLEKFIIGDFALIGELTVDIDLVCKSWNHLWTIYQWENTYRLVKFLRKDSELCAKINISENQAKQLINKLNLTQIPSIFKSGSSWKRET